MARINLLPWRQEERERKNKEFAIMAGAVAALTILIVLLVLTYLNNELSNQQAANDMIRNENARLDGVLTEIESLEQQRTEMLDRMRVIQDLQGRRFVPVRVWDDIARAVPQAMYMTGMRREGQTITFSGFAADANVVSEFVRRLDATPWLGASGVPNIQTDLQAYEVPKSLSQNRPIEDRYVRFTVTTQISANEQVVDVDTVVDTSDTVVTSQAVVVDSDGSVQSDVQTQTTETEAQLAQQQPVDASSSDVAPNQAVPADTSSVPEPIEQQPEPAVQDQATTGGQ